MPIITQDVADQLAKAGWISVAVACKAFGVKKMKLHRAIHSGKIEAKMILSSWFVKKTSMKKFLEAEAAKLEKTAEIKRKLLDQ